MKRIINYITIVAVGLFSFQSFAQEQDSRDFDNYRYPDARGLHQFEDPKDTTSTFDGLKVRIGGAFAIQSPGYEHKSEGTPVDADANPIHLTDTGSNFNLPTANLHLDAHLADGLRMHLRPYLSSRHQPEPYVKGGY